MAQRWKGVGKSAPAAIRPKSFTLYSGRIREQRHYYSGKGHQTIANPEEREIVIRVVYGLREVEQKESPRSF